jgi:exodeoxyribonuclease VII small subunit
LSPIGKSGKPDPDCLINEKQRSANILMKDFEDSLEKLEQLVEKMETGKLTLEETLDCFEKGVQLTATCQKTLKDAEQRIMQVAEKNGLLLETPFANEPTEDTASST